MKVLLSPAKSIDVKGINRVYQSSVPAFLKETHTLVSKLKKMDPVKLGKLMHISSDLAELNVQRYKDWQDPIVQQEEIVPCILAFSGEVYRGMDARTFIDAELEWANDHLRILSGLYGILKPLDLMYPYRLEMGTKWEVSPKARNLYQFWGKKLALYLNDELKKGEVIVNLASTEYFKAVDKKTLKARVITPVFKEFKNGEFKVVMMYAKHARGAMARYIVTNRVEESDELKLYTVEGYEFDEKQSTADEWVFVRG
jgi:hypothetical protein